jgi:hypothetical protein
MSTWKTVVAAAFAILASAAPQLAGAQSYSVPAAVAGPNGSEEYSSGFKFRPFGWSADGKFAWMESRLEEGRGGTAYTWVIYDAVEDSTVYTHSDDSFDWGTDVEASDSEAWKRSGDDVSAALAKNGIVQSSTPIVVSTFPLQRSGDRYTAALSVQNVPDSSEGDDLRIQSYALTLTSRSRGSKVVTRKDKVGAATVDIDGYIASPVEPRIVVVVSESKRAFEGYEKDLFFYGAHLGVGFKK